MQKVFEQFSEKRLLQGIYLELGTIYWGNTTQILVKLFAREKRKRLEVSPLYVPGLYQRKVYWRGFDKVLEIIKDPDNIEPKRPKGHVHADHTTPTYRWSNQYWKSRLREVSGLGDLHWLFWKDDGGSIYLRYFDPDGFTFVKQIAKSNGRTLVGLLRRAMLPTWHTRHGEYFDCPMVFEVVYRLVVREGKGDRSKGYSRLGSTNLDFVRFIVDPLQLPDYAIGYL